MLSAESFFPGKGTPTTQVEMRRLSDGVKTVQRYKTTEQVERAYVEDRDYTYLYQDGDNYVFMNPETYDQVHRLGATWWATTRRYLQEGMAVHRSRSSTATRCRSSCRRRWCWK